MRTGIFIFVLIFILLDTSYIQAQDLSQMGKEKPLTLNGSLSLGTSFYHVNGIDPRRSPFSWRISGNPVLSIYGMRIPFRLAVADQQYSYDHPFRRYGMTPYYKWVKLHLGWSSMNFSPYTFSGRSFFGAGVELTPGKFQFSSFYGKIDDLYARVDTLIYGAERIKTYERNANGIKVGVGSRSNYFNIQVVRATDDLNSPANTTELSAIGVYPEDNVIIGTGLGLRLFKRLSLKLNVAASAYTDDQNKEGLGDIDNERLAGFLEWLQPNRSTVLSYAGDGTVSYSSRAFTIMGVYKRVEPAFRTITTSYNINDFEHYRLQLNMRFFQNFRLQLGGGLQKDNLRQTKQFQTTRWIANANAQYDWNQRLFVNVRYSNFNRSMDESVAAINDTLRRVSVSGQYGLILRYKLGPEKEAGSLGLALTNNLIRDLSPDRRISDIQNSNVVVNGQWGLAGSRLQIRPSINYSLFQYLNVREERYGGSLGVSSKVGENGRWSVTSTYNLNDTNRFRNGYVWRNSLSFGFQISEAHSFSLRLSHIMRASISRKSFIEYRANAGYGYKF